MGLTRKQVAQLYGVTEDEVREAEWEALRQPLTPLRDAIAVVLAQALMLAHARGVEEENPDA